MLNQFVYSVIHVIVGGKDIHKHFIYSRITKHVINML